MKHWSSNNEISKVLDVLTSYPNEFWKYPVVIYYLKYHIDNDFENKFLVFLKRLLSVLLAGYIVTPTINAVKTGILNLNAEIIHSSTPKFHFKEVDEKELKEKIKKAHRNTVRMILKILAYQHQDELLPEKWEIEHILPQKWQPTFFTDIPDKEVKKIVEHIGNKIPFEKKLNIIDSNGYFKKKQESYEKSKVQILLNLSKKNSDWGLDEIHEHNTRISGQLFELLNEWGLNQADDLKIQDTLIPIPSEHMNDYKEFIKMFKKDDNNESRQIFLDIKKEE
ncbi:MAG: HNH endonuclease family protein [Methanobrevibacter sp.]|jgi:hypothetical protein|nr:HNH endonuclease family protein [Candidatus Methanovirga procula]